MYNISKILKIAAQFEKLASIDIGRFSKLCEDLMDASINVNTSSKGGSNIWQRMEKDSKYKEEKNKEFDAIERDFKSTVFGFKQKFPYLIKLSDQISENIKNISIKDINDYNYYYNGFLNSIYSSPEKNAIAALVKKLKENNLYIRIGLRLDKEIGFNLVDTLLQESERIFQYCNNAKSLIDKSESELKESIYEDIKEGKEYLIKHWSDLEPYKRLSAMINNPKFPPKVVYNNLKNNIINLILKIKVKYVYETNKPNTYAYWHPADPDFINLNLGNSNEKYLINNGKGVAIHEISHAIYHYLLEYNYLDQDKYEKLIKDPTGLYSTKLMIEDYDRKQENKPYSENVLTYSYSPTEQSSRVSVVREALGLGNFITPNQLLDKLKQNKIDAMISNNNLYLAKPYKETLDSTDWGVNFHWLSRPFIIQKDVTVGDKIYNVYNLPAIVKMFNSIAVLPKQQQSVPA